MTSIYRPFGTSRPAGQVNEPFPFADPLPPQSMPLPTPDSRNSVVVSGGRVSPYQSPAGTQPMGGTRPFEGTMRPEVPTNMSAYAPPRTPSRSAGMRWNGTQWTTPSTSRAQAKQPQSQGTPYNPGGAYDMDGRFTPNVPIPSQGPSVGGWNGAEWVVPHPLSGGYQSRPPMTISRPTGYRAPGYGGDITPEAMGRPLPPPRPGFVYDSAPSYTPGGGPGNFANMPPDMRPEPFTGTTIGPMGKPMDPSQAFAQRDAFVQSINAARAPLAEAVGRGYRGPPPQRDLGQLWSQAGQMVQDGYQNPFAPSRAMGAVASQAPATRYAPVRDAGPRQAGQQVSGGFGVGERRAPDAPNRPPRELGADGKPVQYLRRVMAWN